MFSKLINLIVDDLILNKKSIASKGNTQVNYNNPLIYTDRPRKTHTEYAKHITKKITKSHNPVNLSIPKTSAARHLSNLTQKSTRTTILLLLLLAAPLSLLFFKHQFFILVFISIGAVSKMSQKYFPLLIGIDFCLFFAILISIAYNPTLGVLTGIISSTLGSFLKQTERIEYYFTPIYGFIPVWIIMSLSIIPATSLLITGMTCVAIYIIARFIMIALTYHLCIANQLTYIATTLIFNYWLLSSVAPLLITIMV